MQWEQKFQDRREAGKKLADELLRYLGVEHTEIGVVLALPRGGVVVGDEVAKALGWPMDVLVVRKIGAPNSSEYGLGAVAESNSAEAEGGVVFYDDVAMRRLDVGREDLEETCRRELDELQRRVEEYRGGRKLIDLEGKVVIIVDDGLATGVTMRAAIMSVNKLQPGKIIVAVPVGARETVAQVAKVAQVAQVVCVREVEDFNGVGSYYENFEQVTDSEVVASLNKYK